MNTTRRIIDANANRVREALRVLEEAARFLIENAKLSHELKKMRHDFTRAMTPFDHLLLHRDTPGDVGTSLTTNAEHQRQNTRDVVLAAGSRLAEALRAIEEYAKIDADQDKQQTKLVLTCEQLRYQSYDLTKRLTLALGTADQQQWRLCLLLTKSLCIHHESFDVLEQALANGVDCVQMREKDWDDNALLERACALRERINGRVPIILNDRPDIAKLCGADGVHLGQTDLPVDRVRSLVGHDLLLGVSTSNLDQAKAAKADGADYCGVGPMFPTTTKHKPEIAGPNYLREYLAWNGLPHLAIGGITPNNLGELVDAGVQGIAVSSAVCSAKDPGKAVKELASQFMETAASPRGSDQ